MSPPLLQARAVVAGYGRVQVLHGVSVDVPAGAVVALLGPNGSGKSTLLQVLAGALPRRGGDVHLDGEPLPRRSPEAVARLGVTLVPEGRGVFPGLSVDDNLVVGLRAGRVPPAERPAALGAVLERFPRLAERRSQRAGTLSGGEQQMLALARALLQRPRVLLLDELSAGLAPGVVAGLLEEVASLRSSGIAVLVAEQEPAHVLELVDFGYVLRRGRVALVGEPAELAGAAAQAGA